MAKEENKSGGLLSKVARFVRHPTVNWSDLDHLSQENEENQYSKQALKEMLERKRQNDFARKREFDHLRKLRQAQLAQSSKAAGVGQTRPIPAATSFLQTVYSGDSGERADTIKKIDEIEAQMAQQWWRGKQAGDAATMPLPLSESGNALPSSFRSPPPGSSPPLLSDALPSDLKLPGNASAQAPLMSGTGIPGLASMRGETDFSPGFAPTEVSAPAEASMVPPSFTRYEHDVALEESAIVFANGDVAGAELGLKALIERRSHDAPAQLSLWLALLDLYRAAGWQEQFDDAGMDFASRFGRSAPQWFAMPQQAGELRDTGSDAGTAAAGFRWQAPVLLGESSLKALQISKARSAGPWTMDWSALEEIEAAALMPLLTAVQQWCDEKGELVFAGHECLLAVMGKHCPSGQADVPPDWWHLRLALQRLMHRQDDFELTALDYCVTYEVSPPSWVDPVSQFLQEGQSGSPAKSISVQGPDTLSPDVLWRERAPRFALQGVIDGDALPWLAQVQDKAKLGEAVAIDCSRLVRMDFAAAGSVLNWAAEMQSLGHVLQFSQLHQLVAVFFNVVGIQEHAQVIPRRD
ncbi:MAG: STAS domain-containing protein [Delftia acidovorans]|jgi:ABC-type transporter Mla MlaB component|nr:STAS domain-containing protein [Delftia acidovorans]